MAEPRWLDELEADAWRGLQRMQMQLLATLSRDLADTSGLSYQDYAVLVPLSERADGRMRAFELGRELGWEKSRLSHHISRMAERGLVTRERCEADLRGAFVVLTPKGRKAIEEAAPAHVDSVRRHFIDLLTPEQLRVVAAVAETVLDRLEADCTEPA